MMMLNGRIVHALTIDDAANFRTDQRTDGRTDEQGDSRSRILDISNQCSCPATKLFSFWKLIKIHCNIFESYFISTSRGDFVHSWWDLSPISIWLDYFNTVGVSCDKYQLWMKFVVEREVHWKAARMGLSPYHLSIANVIWSNLKS